MGKVFSRCKRILGCCIILWCHLGIAQSKGETYVFNTLDRNPTQRGVNAFVQDYLGFIWMGTNGAGLSKYDGTNFTQYKQDFTDPNSLNSSLVYEVYEDSSNRLWVGTEAGLNIYNRDLDVFEDVFLHEGISEPVKTPVRSIVEGPNGELLIGTFFSGLIALNPLTFQFQKIPISPDIPESNLQIRDLVKDKSGTVYAGTNLGLLEYNGVKLGPIDNIDKIEDSRYNYNVESMLLDAEGSLWLGTFDNGVVKISSGSFNGYILDHFEITDKRIMDLAQSPQGNILVATENDGLFVLEKDGKVRKNYRYNKDDDRSLRSNSIWSVFADKQERIWLATYNKGVAVYDTTFDKFKELESIPNKQNSLQAASVTGIVAEKNGMLWLGLDGGGVDVYDARYKEIIHLSDPTNTIAKGLNSLDVVTLFLDAKENLWVGTWKSGIFYLPKGGNAFVHYDVTTTKGTLKSNRVMSFSEDKQGIIWIGTFMAGLHSYNPKTKKFTHQHDRIFEDSTIDQRDVRKVLIATDQSIWLATSGGLFKAVPTSNDSFNLFSLKREMYQNLEKKVFVDVIISLFEDKNKNIWIGTEGDGLFKYDHAAQSFFWYNQSAGLIHETIGAIIEDDKGFIWLGGNKGLSSLDVANNSFTNYDTNDGLLANDFNFNATCKEQNGMLYFGNYNGLNYFDPDSIPTNNHKVKVVLTDFKLFNSSVTPNQKKSPLNKAISETKDLTLNSSQSVFTIEYVGINFTRPEKNRYAYYLEGFEEHWNYVGNTRSATYTNLSPGNYVFKVMAANNDGLWNDTIATLGITVQPPWWASRIAILSYVLLILLLVYVVVKVSDKRLKEKRKAKFKRNRLRQEQALNENKIQFFTNISHEFRTPLTLIINPLEDIMRNPSIQLPESIKNKHNTIHKNASRLKRLIDELMDFRKLQLHKMAVTISEIEVVDFVKTILSYFNEEAALKNIALRVESDEMPITLWSDPGKLEKIIFNILSNAFKVTPENGSVTVGVFVNNPKVDFPLTLQKEPLSAVEISVEDTGSGIKKEEIGSIFDRFYQTQNNKGKYMGGTGIGLEVVKSFVDLLKGVVKVESEEGLGTLFRLFFPLGKEHFKPEELFLNVSNAKVPKTVVPVIENGQAVNVLSQSEQEKKTLLVIEDNTELRVYLKNELENEYHVLQASNGTEGLAHALQKVPDIIITDVIMPEMDGFEFCASIRKDLKTSHIPVLMLTAKSMNEDWVRGIDSGADVYLSKPFDMNVLRAQLKQLILSRQILLRKLLKDVNNIKIPEKSSSLDKNFITKVLDYINKNIADEDLNVEHLADELFLSRSQLYRKIKSLTGHTANEFIRIIRLERAKYLIENSEVSISEVCYKVGFSSPSYFTKCFKTYFGVLPTELKRVH